MDVIDRSGGTIALTLSSDTHLNDVKVAIRAAVRTAQLRVAQQLLADSRAFVPILSGALIDSGRIEVIPPITDDGMEVVRVVYGSTEVVYAEIQHDEPFHHPSLGFFGRALYLRKPYDLNKRYYYELFVLELRRALSQYA